MSPSRFVIVAIVALFLQSGCVNVKAPDNFSIGGRQRDPFDASRVPRTRSHEEARRELEKAHREIQSLQADLRESKKERDRYKRKYKQEKEKNDD